MTILDGGDRRRPRKNGLSERGPRGLQLNGQQDLHPVTDVDRQELWDMLVHRDSDAFALADWKMVEADFVADGFVLIDTHGTVDASAWTIGFPDLDTYARAWLRKATEFQRTLGPDGVRALMREHNRLTRIDIVGNVAIVEKTIGGLLWANSAADIAARSTTTVCCVRRVDGRWRVTSILSRLPVRPHKTQRSTPTWSLHRPAEPRFGAIAAIR